MITIKITEWMRSCRNVDEKCVDIHKYSQLFKNLSFRLPVEKYQLFF